MNQLALNQWPKNHNPDCAELLTMAEQELAAFFRAMTKLFGSRQAEASAEDWLREVTAVKTLPVSPREWRWLTINVAAQRASRVNTADEAA